MRLKMPFHDSPHRHYGLPFFTASMILAHTTVWVLHWVYGEEKSAVRIVGTATTLMVVIGALLLRSHNSPRSKPCEQCMEVPLDPQEAALRKKVLLRSLHWVTETRTRQLAYLGFIIAALVFIIATDGVLARAIGTLVGAVWLWEAWSTNHHNRFQLWCPWCRRGGEGGDVPKDVPDPAVPHPA